MSGVFFDELDLPAPHHTLGIGSGSHGMQTGKMLAEIERVIASEQPDAVVIYGDTNSTLAGALAAAKLRVPVIHIEAGLRSFNKSMPEEINRIVADHSSTLLFSPTLAGLRNLEKEGFASIDQAMGKGPASVDNPFVFHCGDLMFDNTLFFSEKADLQHSFFDNHGINKDNFVLTTIHRPVNTDDTRALTDILTALNDISVSDGTEFVLPIHPRTANAIAQATGEPTRELLKNPRFKIIEPVGFLEMLLLEKHAKMVMTDSGGVQKEAFFLKKPCIILRSETEWTEMVECGSATLVGSDPVKIRAAYNHFNTHPKLEFPLIFGNGTAATFICESIIKHLN